jgi:hypothetical protein
MKDLLLNSEWIISIITVLVAAVLTSMLLKIFLRKEREKKPSDKEKFFNAFDKKFDSNLINGKDDLMIILNSISRESENYYSIAPILEDYITYHLDKQTKDNKENDEEIKRRYKLLKEIIAEENKEKPFENVPDAERRLLVGIKDGIQNNDIPSLEFNLHELHTVISTRNKIYERVSKLNRWAIPLAVIGTFFTILFGILSLTPNLDSEKLDMMNKDIIEKIEMINIQDTLKQIPAHNNVYKK